MIDIYWNIRTSASRWFYYKTLNWNFKYCCVQIENVSYWLKDKQSKSKHVSLRQGIRFSIGFPLTTNLRFSIGFSLRACKRYVLCTCHQNRHNSVAHGNTKIVWKELPKLFSCDYLTICRNVARWDAKEKRNQDFDYCEEYLTRASNKILLWKS